MHCATPLATLSLALALAAAGEPVQPGGFAPAAEMTAARVAHSATLLRDGTVLLAGGREGRWPWRSALASAELYDPRAGAFIATAPMSVARASHAATLLADGRVLIVGPNGGAGAELYDPATGAFRVTGSPRSTQPILSAELLPSGKVLVAGRDRAELYDPATETFEAAAPYPRRSWDYDEHYYPTATRLADGRVLLAGELPWLVYDPARDEFEAVPYPEIDPGPSSWLWAQSATLLSSSEVLVAGGLADDSFTSAFAWLYDPATGEYGATRPMPTPRQGHAAVALADGRVLIVGGTHRCPGSIRDCPAIDALLFDTQGRTFGPAPDPLFAREFPRATLLADGEVLVTGGANRTAELYRAGPAPLASLLVAEYYDTVLDRYFFTADRIERMVLDGAAPGSRWARTGQAFRASTEPHAGWDAVCRFRRLRPASSDFSYFYTIEPPECDAVKRDPAWVYEGVAFYAVRVRGGACPGPLRTLLRAYRSSPGEPSHRYATERSLLEAMAAAGWSFEGEAMCVGP